MSAGKLSIAIPIKSSKPMNCDRISHSALFVKTRSLDLPNDLRHTLRLSNVTHV
jgi:hypothetical protein